MEILNKCIIYSTEENVEGHFPIHEKLFCI